MHYTDRVQHRKTAGWDLDCLQSIVAWGFLVMWNRIFPKKRSSLVVKANRFLASPTLTVNFLKSKSKCLTSDTS